MSKESRRAARNAARTGSTAPSGAERAGRRDRVRPYDQKSFFERRRSLIIGGVVVLVGAVVVGLVVVQSTQAAFTARAVGAWEVP